MVSNDSVNILYKSSPYKVEQSLVVAFMTAHNAVIKYMTTQRCVASMFLKQAALKTTR